MGTACYSAVFGAPPKCLSVTDGRQDYLMTIYTSDYEVALEGKRQLFIKAGDITLAKDSSAMAFALPTTLFKGLSLEEARLATLAPHVWTCAASPHIGERDRSEPAAGLCRPAAGGGPRR